MPSVPSVRLFLIRIRHYRQPTMIRASVVRVNLEISLPQFQRHCLNQPQIALARQALVGDRKRRIKPWPPCPATPLQHAFIVANAQLRPCSRGSEKLPHPASRMPRRSAHETAHIPVRPGLRSLPARTFDFLAYLFSLCLSSIWSGRRGSNPRPTAWKAVTLPLSYSREKQFVSSQFSVISLSCRWKPNLNSA